MDTSEKAYARFGLDPTKLEIENLLKNRSYRRLYNIVANDQACSNSLFRPNLIKEMYFLLQITPFIEESLQEHFLDSIEEWYNSNDHKKIQLSKNLQGKVDSIFKSTTKESGSLVRPKTGVQWDSSLNPVLRPYTAKLKRPVTASSNKEKEGVQSTHANTFQATSQMPQESNNLKNIIDIEEEWERSQDFTKKFRTLHPEEEPTYEKLLNIIQRVSMIGSETNSVHLPPKPKRNIQSAMLNREATKKVAEEEIQEMKKCFREEQEGQMELGEEQEEDVLPSEAALEDGDIEFGGQKCFLKDKRTKTGNQNCRMYTRVNGLKIVRPLTGKQANIIQRLGTYSNEQRNKFDRKMNEDEEFAQHYHQYVRNKTSLKRELARKTESIRMLKTAATPPLRNINANKENISPNPSVTPSSGPKVHALKDPFLTEVKDEKVYTHYNQNTFFEKSLKERVQSAKRGLHEVQRPLQKVSSQAKLTKNTRFMSELKFNPLNAYSRDQYNQQILSDIEKIKARFGGQNSVATEALMKALYVDTPDPAFEFQIPNKAYLMLSKGEKKKKKKPKRRNLSRPKTKS